MIYSITTEDLIVDMGGHARAGFGSQRHLPIFLGADGVEYISLNGQTLVPISALKDKNTRRETVVRG